MKKGKKESYDLIVNINLDEWKLTPEQEIFLTNIFPRLDNYIPNVQVAELKEVFMLFDRDEDGVLSFQELQLVMLQVF